MLSRHKRFLLKEALLSQRGRAMLRVGQYDTWSAVFCYYLFQSVQLIDILAARGRVAVKYSG